MPNFAKKILIVSSYYPPHKGGLEIVVKRHAESLALAGYKVSVLTTGKDKNTKTTENKVDIYRLKAINFFEDKLGIPFPLVGLKFINKVRMAIADSDLVHINDVFYTTSWIAYLICKYYKKPLYLTQHVAIVDHKNPIVIKLQKFVYKMAGDQIFKYSKKIIVYNDIVKEFIKSRGINPIKIHELKNGIDTDYFSPVDRISKNKIKKELGIYSKKPIVLFAGRLVSKKGFDKVFESRNSLYDIIIAGPGKVPNGWEGTEGVRFVGEYDYPMIRKYYRAADIFVFPAVGEIFTIVMQEAMSCGLPVITTDDPGYQKYNLDRNLISLIKREPSTIRNEIIKIINNKRKYNDMRKYSIKMANMYFNWDKNFNDHLKIYETIKS